MFSMIALASKRLTASLCSVLGSCLLRNSAKRAGSRRVNSSTITARASAGMASNVLLMDSSTCPGLFRQFDICSSRPLS